MLNQATLENKILRFKLSAAKSAPVLALTCLIASMSIAQVSSAIVPQGQSFQFDRAFSAQITAARLTTNLGEGKYATQSGPNEQFLVLTLKLQSNAKVPLPPPVPEIRWLSTPDGSHSVKPDLQLDSIYNDPKLGGMSGTPIKPGDHGNLIAIYRVKNSVDIYGLLYNVSWDAQALKLVLAQLPTHFLDSAR